MTEETSSLQWSIHDDGFWHAKGRKGRYEISEGFGKMHGFALVVLPSRLRIWCNWEDAKSVAQGYDE